jgi:hypothetical protein
MDDENTVVRVLYRNWRGEVAWRRIRPIRLEWPPDGRPHSNQWLLRCWDLDREAERSYAFQDMITPMIPEKQFLAHEQEYRDWAERLLAVAVPNLSVDERK